jgi:hypothetical protein
MFTNNFKERKGNRKRRNPERRLRSRTCKKKKKEMKVTVAKEMMKKEMMMIMVKQKNTRKNIRELIKLLPVYVGARGSVVVKALCYKPEGRGFDTR